MNLGSMPVAIIHTAIERHNRIQGNIKSTTLQIFLPRTLYQRSLVVRTNMIPSVVVSAKAFLLREMGRAFVSQRRLIAMWQWNSSLVLNIWPTTATLSGTASRSGDHRKSKRLVAFQIFP